MISWTVNGWGELEADGTWTAYCQITAGIHVTTVHETGFKDEKGAEDWSRARAQQAAQLIKNHGMKFKKTFDCRIKAVD